MNMIWDSENQSIRGSFVNLVITFSILGCIVYGLIFSNEVINRIKTVETLLIGFFTASFGIWSARQILESKKT